MTGPRISIGKHYEQRPSMFSHRTGTGGFQHVMPPMTADEEQLQAALLAARENDKWLRRLAMTVVTRAIVLAGMVAGFLWLIGDLRP